LGGVRLESMAEPGRRQSALLGAADFLQDRGFLRGRNFGGVSEIHEHPLAPLLVLGLANGPLTNHGGDDLLPRDAVSPCLALEPGVLGLREPHGDRTGRLGGVGHGFERSAFASDWALQPRVDTIKAVGSKHMSTPAGRLGRSGPPLSQLGLPSNLPQKEHRE